ncbi:hypothetical protein B5M09_009814 [Aphanomyces astaci]|uniref:Uncharacterized protein n=1 Tax=Aphanomyces astaci TaxID=112090 RepID=A0A425DAA7_APHAT|nr:hypothetical protein B5M09_009814 [Aphanomyces astaci]
MVVVNSRLYLVVHIAPHLANTLTNPAATDLGHRQLAAGNQKAMSAGSLRVATYMQEHPDDAAELRDQLKFWNEVMDHQVPMTKERAEATLPFITALEWGPLFTNTSPQSCSVLRGSIPSMYTAHFLRRNHPPIFTPPGPPTNTGLANQSIWFDRTRSLTSHWTNCVHP